MNKKNTERSYFSFQNIFGASHLNTFIIGLYSVTRQTAEIWTTVFMF